MKDKILALLLTAFAGVRRDGLNQLAGSLALTINTDEEATEVVGKLTADTVNKFITDWRKEADAEISRANKSYEDGLRKKYDFVDKKSQEGSTPPTTVETGAENSDAAAMKQLLQSVVNDTLQPILARLDKFEAEDVGQKRTKELNERLKDCKDENLKNLVLKNFSRMKFDDDESFTQFLDETADDISKANQNISDTNLGNQGKPWKSSSAFRAKEATEAEINAVMDKIPL